VFEIAIVAFHCWWTHQCHHVAGEHRTTQCEQDPDDEIVAQQQSLGKNTLSNNTWAEHAPSVPVFKPNLHTRKRETFAMGFHHVALATRDTAATHRFYTEVMGFELAKVVTSPTPGEHGGWSKHFFYSTNGTGTAGGDQGMIAFWEIHDSEIGDDFPVDINAAAGLPWWVNHIAFDAPTLADLERHRERWRQHGHTVLEVDHDFCISIYIRDPSKNMVEFCHTTRAFTDAELAGAKAALLETQPAFEAHAPKVTVHQPTAGASIS
jgi:catechol 2,3-dioxygenase-like lactoylglutathione lyase family enzyme